MTGFRVSDRDPRQKDKDYAEFMAAMAPHVLRAVEASFFEAASLHPTNALVRERTNRCYEIVRTLKMDMHWTRQKIASRLPDILRRELLGDGAALDREVSAEKDQAERHAAKREAHGITSVDAGGSTYAVDPASLEAQWNLKKPSAETTQGLDENFGEDELGEDMAGGDDSIPGLVDTTDFPEK